MAVESTAGDSQVLIAERHGVCTRTVRRGIARAKAAGRSEKVDMDPLDQLRARQVQLDASIEELAIGRQMASSPAESFRMLRLQADLMIDQMELLANLGALCPSSPEKRTVAGVKTVRLTLGEDYRPGPSPSQAQEPETPSECEGGCP
jgi:hypothetical protein